MKKIEIIIEHNLTPFHEETMLKMIELHVLALNEFWKSRSKKTFNMKIK